MRAIEIRRPSEIAEAAASQPVPFSIEAEQQLLGALLTNNEVYDHVSRIIQPRHFYDPVHRRIYEISRTEHERAGMGTTLTALYVDESNLAVAHVGDSRAYLFREGQLGRLTQDHTLVEELVRRGKLTQEQAAEHPQRSIITRALGVDPEVDVDTWTYTARGGDIVLMCSDGLTSMISEERITAVLESEHDLERAADRLIAEANEAGGRDNITATLARFEALAAPDTSDNLHTDAVSGDEPATHAL